MKKTKPQLYSYWKTYACGCAAHLYKTPEYKPVDTEPCWLCAHPQNPEWVEMSAGLKQKRKAAGIAVDEIPGLTDEDVLLMEKGRRNPEPLKAFLDTIVTPEQVIKK